MTRRRPLRILGSIVAVAVLGAASTADARTITGGGSDHVALHWTPVTGVRRDVAGNLGLLRTGDGALHVAWPDRDTLRQAVVAVGGGVSQAPPIVSGWTSVTAPALLPGPGGTLQAFFGGIHSQQAADPLRDLNLATSPDGGATWTVQPRPVSALDTGKDYAYTSPITAVNAGADQHPIEAWSGGAGLFTHVGTSPDTPDVRIAPPGPMLAHLVTTPQGGVALASVSLRPPALTVQRLNPTTGAPVGAPAVFPDLVTADGLDTELQRTPLVGRARFDEFFSAYRGAASAGDAVRVWGVGQAHSTEFLPHRRGAPQSLATIDGDSAGRLWLAYSASINGHLALTTERSDATSARVALFGRRVVSTLPEGTLSVLSVETSAQDDRLDVLVTVTTAAGVQTFAAQARPGLTLTDVVSRKRHVVTFHVADAGVAVGGAHVTYGGRSGRTGASGSVVLPLARARAATASAAGHADTTAEVAS